MEEVLKGLTGPFLAAWQDVPRQPRPEERDPSPFENVLALLNTPWAFDLSEEKVVASFVAQVIADSEDSPKGQVGEAIDLFREFVKNVHPVIIARTLSYPLAIWSFVEVGVPPYTIYNHILDGGYSSQSQYRMLTAERAKEALVQQEGHNDGIRRITQEEWDSILDRLSASQGGLRLVSGGKSAVEPA